jgi:hypothetical protein
MSLFFVILVLFSWNRRWLILLIGVGLAHYVLGSAALFLARVELFIIVFWLTVILGALYIQRALITSYKVSMT